MKKLLLEILLLLFLAESGHAQTAIQASCAVKANSIKIGITRAEVEKWFQSDCGSDKSNECNLNDRRFRKERYVLTGCHLEGNKSIQFDIDFKPFGIDDKIYENPVLFHKWLMAQIEQKPSLLNPGDVVTKISGPYYEYMPCAEKLNIIKVGMTRADLEKSFVEDGGISDGYTNIGYSLKGCFCQGSAEKSIKVFVSFKSKVNNATDVITKISQPYCGYGIAD